MRGPSETGRRSENVSFGRGLSAKSWTMLLVKVNLPSKPCTAPLRPWQIGLRACSMHPKNTLLSHMASWKLAAALFNKHVKSGMPMLIEHVKRLQNRSFSYPWTSWWIFATGPYALGYFLPFSPEIDDRQLEFWEPYFWYNIFSFLYYSVSWYSLLQPPSGGDCEGSSSWQNSAQGECIAVARAGNFSS